MIGAVIGDIVGSRFEWKNIKSKDFELFTDECCPTDDSIMTIAVMDAICRSDCVATIGEYAVQSMQSLGRSYPNCGFGSNFYNWIFSKNPTPYESWGNGAAMRISPVGFFAKDFAEAHALSHEITAVSHNHLESYKAAEAVASAIWLARNGMTKDELHNYICKFYYPPRQNSRRDTADVPVRRELSGVCAAGFSGVL